MMALLFRGGTIPKKEYDKMTETVNKITNQTGIEWRKPLLRLAKEIHQKKPYIKKTDAIKEAFLSMPKEFQDKYFDEYTENESAIIRQFQRMK